MSDRHEMQAAGTHPAPCARHCESTAYEIEIRRLRAELAASREREARMRAMLQAADVLFAHHCRDCTALNWLDDTRALIKHDCVTWPNPHQIIKEQA